MVCRLISKLLISKIDNHFWGLVFIFIEIIVGLYYPTTSMLDVYDSSLQREHPTYTYKIQSNLSNIHITGILSSSLANKRQNYICISTWCWQP